MIPEVLLLRPALFTSTHGTPGVADALVSHRPSRRGYFLRSLVACLLTLGSRQRTSVIISGPVVPLLIVNMSPQFSKRTPHSRTISRHIAVVGSISAAMQRTGHR